MSTVAEMSLQNLDLNNPELFADGPPHALFARMRAEAPVLWNRPTEINDGFWSVTGYADEGRGRQRLEDLLLGPARHLPAGGGDPAQGVHQLPVLHDGPARPRQAPRDPEQGLHPARGGRA